MLGAIQQKYSRLYHCPGRHFIASSSWPPNPYLEFLMNYLPMYVLELLLSHATSTAWFASRMAVGVFHDDAQADFRGFAIKVPGVKGRPAQSGGSAKEHNILMVQTDPFGAHSLDFIHLAQIADAGEADDNSARSSSSLLRFCSRHVSHADALLCWAVRCSWPTDAINGPKCRSKRQQWMGR